MVDETTHPSAGRDRAEGEEVKKTKSRGRRTKRMLVALRDWTLPELLPGAMWPAMSAEPGKDLGPKANRAKSSRKKAPR